MFQLSFSPRNVKRFTSDWSQLSGMFDSGWSEHRIQTCWLCLVVQPRFCIAMCVCINGDLEIMGEEWRKDQQIEGIGYR